MIDEGKTASPTIASLMRSLVIDPWRQSQGFSPEVSEANASLWNAQEPSRAHDELLKWIGKWQPCLFGRMAARHSAISTCILFDRQLRSETDDWIADQIQQARTQWTRDAFYGETSAFVILLISESLASALPDANMLKLATRLCNLYLLRGDVDADHIYYDEVFLEASDRERSAWKWLAGVNFFAASGDGRWWHDHRIPGGVALSINSVGHLVKSRILAKAEAQFASMVDLPADVDDLAKIDSLETALVWAMRTIHGASQANSGRATFLVDRVPGSPEAPCELPPFLREFDHRFYRGFYHTDFTLPSVYFRPDVLKPEMLPTDLDFTYLTEKGSANPDHVLMGSGRRIRSERDPDDPHRNALSSPVRVQIQDAPALAKALG